MQQVGAARQLLFLRRAGTQHDFARLALVELFRLEGIQVREGLGDQRLQVGEGRFGVFPRRDLYARQARCDALGEVRGNLHLARQREHVGEEAGAQIGLRIDVLGGGVVFGLLEHVGQGGQHLLDDGNGGVVHGAGHDGFRLIVERGVGATRLGQD
ncbi:hypothetical protein D3C72_1886470 [compost metagenome]